MLHKNENNPKMKIKIIILCEDNLKIYDDLKNENNLKTSWGRAGPSSAQAGTGLYSN